jgi:hypothetical protein
MASRAARLRRAERASEGKTAGAEAREEVDAGDK